MRLTQRQTNEVASQRLASLSLALPLQLIISPPAISDPHTNPKFNSLREAPSHSMDLHKGKKVGGNEVGVDLTCITITRTSSSMNYPLNGGMAT